MKEKRLARIAALLFLLPSFLVAAERFTDQCRIDSGAVSANCLVTIFNAGTVDLSSIFSDSGLTIAKSNPFTADNDGRHFFYAADGQYDVQWSGGTPVIDTTTIGDVSLGTGGAHPLTSVFSRAGIVTAQPGDYTAAQVTNAARTDANNLYGAIFHEVTGLTTPATPASGKGRLFFDSADDIWKIRKDTGTVVSLEAGGGTAAHDLLSATHGDTTAAAVSRGSLVVGQTATPVWQELVIGGSATFLRSDGTDATWAAIARTDINELLHSQNVSDYNWSRNPGGTLIIGVNTVTLTPGPLGVSGSNTDLDIRITDATSGNENALVTGGTCDGTPLASCTVQFTGTIAHAAGQWTIGSATGGLEECFSDISIGGACFVTTQVLTYAETNIKTNHVALLCNTAGGGGSISPRTNNINVFTIDMASGFANFTADGCELEGTFATGETAFNAVSENNIRLHNLVINRMQGTDFDRVVDFEIIDVTFGSDVYFVVGSTVDGAGNFAINVKVDGLRQKSTGSAWTDTNDFFTCSRCLQTNISNVSIRSMNGLADGIVLANQNEGTKLSNISIVDVNTCVRLKSTTVGGTTTAPNWTQLLGLECDQSEENGVVVETGARFNTLAHVYDTGGPAGKTSSIHLQAGSIETQIISPELQSPVSGQSQILVDAGVSNWSLVGGRIETIAGGTGINILAGASDDFIIAGVSLTGAGTLLTDGSTGDNKQIFGNNPLSLGHTMSGNFILDDGDLHVRNAVTGPKVKLEDVGGITFELTVGGSGNFLINNPANGGNELVLTPTGFLTILGNALIGQELQFTEAAGDPGCVTGEFWIAANDISNLLRKCQDGAISDLDTSGAVRWDELSDPTGAVSMTSNAVAELMTWSFDAAYGATDNAFLLQQQTGNVASGFVLADFRAVDTDAVVLRAGDGTNGVTVSQAGALTAEGTGSITATALASDALDAMSEIAAGIKRGPDATDTHLLTTDVAAPAGLRCLQMDTDGSVVLDTDTCSNLGPGGTTTIDALGDAAGIGVVAVADFAQTWDWDSPATSVAKDAFTLNYTLDASTDATTQRVLRVVRPEAANTGTLEALVSIENLDTAAVVTAAIEIRSSAGGITRALDLNDAQITTLIEFTTGSISPSDLELLDDGTITLTTETTGSYAAGDAEAGAALTGDNAGSFFAAGELEVARGGSGVATITGLIQGNGASDFTAITNSSTVGQVLRVTGASVYAWGPLDLADGDAVTGVLDEANLDANVVLDNAANIYSTGDQNFSAATALEVPNGAAPSTTNFGELAADNDAWAASRGALQHFDGTANTFVVAALASDVPTNLQVPKWNTDGTITWEDDVSGGSPTWDTIADPVAVQTITFGAVAEVTAFSFDAAHTADMFTIRQQTGNPTTGALLRVTASDTTIEMFRVDLASTDLFVVETDSDLRIGDNTPHTLTFVAGASDPVLSLSSGVADWTTGVLQVGGSVVATAANTVTLTNKTQDAEATGNNFTEPIRIMLMAAGSQAGTAAAAFNTPSTNAPAAVDKSSGGFLGAALDFDDTTDESVQWTTKLPVGFDESNFDLEFTWFGTATSGSVVWDAQSACIGEDEAISDLSFNTEGTVTSAAAAVTLDLQAATISNLSMTNCSDGEHMWIEFRRDVDPTDDFSGDASLWSVELIARVTK